MKGVYIYIVGTHKMVYHKPLLRR